MGKGADRLKSFCREICGRVENQELAIFPGPRTEYGTIDRR
jgi:hypothetical protein